MSWRLLLCSGLLFIGILAIGSGLVLYCAVPSGPGLLAPERAFVIDDAAVHQSQPLTIPLQNNAGHPLRVVGIGTC